MNPATLSDLSSRSIIGEFYAALEQDLGASWMEPITNVFPTNQESETYRWLGQTPQMREWIGGRHAKGLEVEGMTIKNKLYEATLEIGIDDIRRDKTGQIMARVRELATRANAHWAKLLASLLLAGTNTTCYDGAYFFDTSHISDSPVTQSNHLSVARATSGITTAGDMEGAILNAVEQMLGFVDDVGEPFNENARQFMVLVGPQLLSPAAAALKNPIILDRGTSRTNVIVNIGGYGFDLAVSARLLTLGNSFYVFRTDAPTRALIRQEEVPITVDAIAEGSELEFRERKHQYGVTTIRNVGFGYWQRAVQVDITG
jgi:phage major head subunit gpT-like protein